MATCGAAQNAARSARIGSLNSIHSSSVDAALAEGLRGLGWIERKNLSIERRVFSGDAECLVKSAVELVALNVEVIVAEATASTQAAKAATSSIPIVFAATGDPVGQGFVASLAHPGGNLTGTSFDAGPEIPTKQLQLVIETVPRVSRVAVLSNPTSPFIRTYWQFLQDAASTLRVRLHSEQVKESKDFVPAFDAIAREHADALIVLSDAFIVYDHARSLIIPVPAGGRGMPAVELYPRG